MSERWSPQELAAQLDRNPSLRMSRTRRHRTVVPKDKPSGKPNKFHAKQIVVEGITFHSKREATRYGELRVLERAGKIVGLDMQVKYPLVVNGHLIANYFADFTYSENGKFILEDSKGFATKEYKLKKKLLKAIWGYEIRET